MSPQNFAEFGSLFNKKMKMNKHIRPSIKEILSEDYWKNNETETKLSLKDIFKIVGILGGMSIISGSGIF